METLLKAVTFKESFMEAHVARKAVESVIYTCILITDV
jgi:hypothetical protein